MDILILLIMSSVVFLITTVYFMVKRDKYKEKYIDEYDKRLDLESDRKFHIKKEKDYQKMYENMKDKYEKWSDKTIKKDKKVAELKEEIRQLKAKPKDLLITFNSGNEKKLEGVVKGKVKQHNITHEPVHMFYKNFDDDDSCFAVKEDYIFSIEVLNEEE